MVLLSFVISFSKQKAAQAAMPKFTELTHEDRTHLDNREQLSQLPLSNDTAPPRSGKPLPICQSSSA